MDRPNAEQITDCLLGMLKDTLMWSPPDPENVIKDDVINNNDEHEDYLSETESAIDDDTNEEVDETNNETGRDDELRSESCDMLELDEESVEYGDVSGSIQISQVSIDTENATPPLLVSVTTDGANVLKGRRTGVSARLRSLCNKLLLHSHCIFTSMPT